MKLPTQMLFTMPKQRDIQKQSNIYINNDKMLSLNTFEESERYIFMVGKRQRYVGSRSEKLGFADPNPNSWGAVKRGRTSWADVKDGTTWNKIVNTEYVGKIWK